MPANRQPSGSCRPRNWRGLLAVLIALTYLFAGAAHELCDIDVTSPAGGSEIAFILEDVAADHGDHKAPAGHHCHGCFSVAIVPQLPAAIAADIVAAPITQPQPALVGIAADTTSPPPKHLT